MSQDLVFWEWLMFFCLVTVIFIFLYAAMRYFEFSRKAFLKSGAFFFIFLAFSQFFDAGAEYFGLTWLWFSNGQVLSLLLGLVCGSVYIGIRRLIKGWL